jgi:hypothetical protein
MTPDLPVQAQLELLRDQTNVWSIVYEPQVLQLKSWIYLAVPEVESFDIEVDFERWTVRYRCVVPRGTLQEPTKLQGLGRSVRWLLGEGWDLEVEAGWTFKELGDVTCRTRSRKRAESPPEKRPSGASNRGKGRRSKSTSKAPSPL